MNNWYQVHVQHSAFPPLEISYLFLIICQHSEPLHLTDVMRNMYVSGLSTNVPNRPVVQCLFNKLQVTKCHFIII